MPPEQPPLIVAVARFRRALAQRDAQALDRIINAYGRIYQRLQDKIDLLVAEIGGQAVTRGQLVRMVRYRELIAQVNEELSAFQGFMRTELGAAGEFGVGQGIRDARQLLSYAVAGDAQIVGAFNVLPRDAIESVLGFLSPEGPLYARLAELAPTTVDAVVNGIVEGVGLGYNPRKIARLIRDDLGSGLTDALRMTRTVQLYSYREANRATYIANSDVVEGWIWHAELGPRTCLSCINMHGTFHALDETLNDHHNGRCAMVPAVRGFDRVVQEGAGKEWFEGLSEAEQRQMMGQSKWDAWREGRFDFSALTGAHDDAVYGQMRIEQSLQAILGQ